MIGFAQGELLGQVKPATTSPVAIYTASMRTEVLLIAAVVLSGEPEISIYHDDEATEVFDSSNQIYFAAREVGGNPFVFQARGAGGGILARPDGIIAVQTSVADAVTFSVYGITATLADRVRGLD